MNWFDFAILSVIAFSALISIVRGFVKEAISLAIWISAFFVAKHFYPLLAIHFSSIRDEIVRNGIAIALLFIGTLIAGALLNYLVSQLVKTTGLGGTDKAVGAVFGALRGILIVSAVLFFLDTFTSASSADWWVSSLLVPEFGGVIEWFFEFVEQNSSFLPST
ncbi:MAG: CvpA family protein [Pseudomonadota bacterium]